MKKSLIPKGHYCYKIKNGLIELCPFWRERVYYKNKLVEGREDGYCKFLKKGDIEINDEARKESSIMWKRLRNGKYRKYVYGPGKNPMGYQNSLLWDQVKECGINMKEKP